MISILKRPQTSAERPLSEMVAVNALDKKTEISVIEKSAFSSALKISKGLLVPTENKEAAG